MIRTRMQQSKPKLPALLFDFPADQRWSCCFIRTVVRRIWEPPMKHALIESYGGLGTSSEARPLIMKGSRVGLQPGNQLV